MKIERAILIGFLGNYLINTVIAALASLIRVGGATGVLSPQYITFAVVSVFVVAILAWWYMREGTRSLKSGLIFGVIAFLVAIATAFVTGVFGVLGQTGSFASVIGVLPNFGPFLWNWSTLVQFGYWVIGAGLIGWWLEPKASAAQRPSVSSMPSGGMGM